MYFIVLRYICIINKISLDYLSTNEDAKVIEYMETIKDEKHVLVRIDDCYGERRDMDCLFKDGEHVNGSVSIFNTTSVLTLFRMKYLSII